MTYNDQRPGSGYAANKYVLCASLTTNHSSLSIAIVDLYEMVLSSQKPINESSTYSVHSIHS